MSEELTRQIINEAVRALVPAFVSLALLVLSRLGMQAHAYVSARLSRESVEFLDLVIARAVLAAEQVAASAPGRERLDYALTIVQKEALRLGLPIDVTVLIGMIEAEVKRQKAASQ